MKKIYAVLFSLSLITFFNYVFPTVSHAQTVCEKNIFNQVVCTNSSTGGRTTIDKDIFGNDNYRSSNGATKTCHYNIFKQYVCN